METTIRVQTLIYGKEATTQIAVSYTHLQHWIVRYWKIQQRISRYWKIRHRITPVSYTHLENHLHTPTIRVTIQVIQNDSRWGMRKFTERDADKNQQNCIVKVEIENDLQIIH